MSGSTLNLATGNGLDVLFTGSSTLSGNVAAGQMLLVQGNGTVGAATLTSANSYSNGGTITLDSTHSSYGSYLTLTTGTLTNTASGTVNVISTGVGARQISAALNNSSGGNLNVDASLLFARSGAVHTNTGTASIANNQSVSFSGSQTWNQETLGTLKVDVDTVAAGTGAFEMSGDTLNFNGGTIQGRPQLNSSTLNLATGNGLDLLFTGSSTLSGNVAAGQMLLVQGNGTVGAATLTSANSYSNGGTITLDSTHGSYGAYLTLTAGTLTNSGTVNALSGAGGARIMTGALLNSTGTVRVHPGVVFDVGTFTQEAGGTLNIVPGSSGKLDATTTTLAGTLSLFSSATPVAACHSQLYLTSTNAIAGDFTVFTGAAALRRVLTSTSQSVVTLEASPAAGVSVGPGTVNAAEGGGAATYSACLNSTSAPTGNVTVTRGFTSGDITVTPESVTFTSGDWQQPKSFSAAAVQDSDNEEDIEAVTVTHAVTGALTGSASSVTVNVADDDGVGAAKALVFTSQPVKGGHSFSFGIQPVVAVKEGVTTVTSDSSVVTLRIRPGSGTEGATLSCTDGQARTATLGVATFAGCKIDLKGQDYVLEATADGMALGVTDPFDVIWAGDANGDCHVDVQDFSILVRSFFRDLGELGYDARADLSGDNKVDTDDFSHLVPLFGIRCASVEVFMSSGGAGTLVTVTGSAYVAHKEVTVTRNGVPEVMDP